MRHVISPLGAVARGAIAGVIGSAVMNVFFKLSPQITPKTPPDAFVPPDPEQRGEGPLETVSRRLVEGFMRRGPLDEAAKERLARAMHYGLGAGWGVAYGLTRESFPSVASVGGMAGYSVAVWAVSEDLLSPALNLAAWPNRYPLNVHAYAVAAHVVFGAAVWASYEAIRPRSWQLLQAGLGALLVRQSLRRRLPKALRPVGRGAGKAVSFWMRRPSLADLGVAVRA